MTNTKVICPVCGSEIAISNSEKTVKNATIIGKNSGRGTVELPIAKVGNKADDRLAALKAAGVDISNLFAMRSASGEGMLVRLNNGVPEAVDENDPIFAKILNGGTIPERRLFRRWVTSQMFTLLTMKNYYTGATMSINDAIRRHGYEYQWKMTLEELRVQCSLDRNDMENYYMRNKWFNRDVCIKLAEHYCEELKKHVDGLVVHKCKGFPYKKIAGRDIFLNDIYRKVYAPLFDAIKAISSARRSQDLYRAMLAFNKNRIKIGFKTPFCQAWLDAFKGSGAYFTMRNLIMFHGCCIHGTRSNEVYTKETSLKLLDERAVEYCHDGWRMFAMMQKLIKDNNINIAAKKKAWREAKRY